MTSIQQQAIDLISKLPDEKVYYLINFLEGFGQPLETMENDDAWKAYQNIQKYRKPSSADRDYGMELNAAREKKYADID